MIIIFIRAIILFAVLLLVFRLMGKRQIGEMEPFELVITLVISELACIPMADRSIPITFGIVAILTMFVIHQFILILSHSDKLQGIINGKPVMVVNGGNIDVQALKSLNMHVNDLLQAMRAAEYFSLEEIIYGIMETNGLRAPSGVRFFAGGDALLWACEQDCYDMALVSVVGVRGLRAVCRLLERRIPVLLANKDMEDRQQTLPVPLILEGKWNDENINGNGFDKRELQQLLAAEHAKLKNVVLLAIDENNRMTVQKRNAPIYFKDVEVTRK